jgi:hypothetical protein
VYEIDDAGDFLAGAGIDAQAAAAVAGGKFMSAFIRARKPRA